MKNSIWIWVHQKAGDIEDVTFGLLQEARQIVADSTDQYTIVAVAAGDDLDDRPPLISNDDDPGDSHPMGLLGTCGVDRVIQVKGVSSSGYHGESFAESLSGIMKEESPLFFFMAHDTDTADLAPRLAAKLKLPMASRAVDLRIDSKKIPTIVRPIANGHLFETLTYTPGTPLIVTFLPNVLNSSQIKPAPDKEPVEIHSIDAKRNKKFDLKTRIVDVIEASPEQIDITEADIIVAAGRGVSQSEDKEKGLESIYELAGLLGGSVAGTRPVIDRDDLPFERQIGQTGKTVEPRLIINCGISGANEYTAGIEKAKKIIAINTDPTARIFQFSDLGIIGDLDLILPLLNKTLTRLKNIETEE